MDLNNDHTEIAEIPDCNSDPSAFFLWLKNNSEEFWANSVIDTSIYGFQIQPGTKWNDGISNKQIDEFESILSELEFGATDEIKFPEIYRIFLQNMNGTTPDTINIYGNSGEDPSYAPGYYSFPRDIEKIKEMVLWIFEENNVTSGKMKEKKIPPIIPITGHRFLIIESQNPILSMYGDDIITYARDLPTFLINDIFYNHQFDTKADKIGVKYWLR